MEYDITRPAKSQAKPKIKLRFEARKKPDECPACGSDRIALIVYGLPPPNLEILKLHKEGLLHFGGSLVTGDDPHWRCMSCGAEIYKSARPYRRAS